LEDDGESGIGQTGAGAGGESGDWAGDDELFRFLADELWVLREVGECRDGYEAEKHGEIAGVQVKPRAAVPREKHERLSRAER
jgi:hypothetical protein